MQPPARLPVELYRPIVQQVGPRKVFYNLLFVSRAFWNEAERVLYGKITLQGIRRPLHFQVFETLASCNRIALLVHHLFIFLYARRAKDMYQEISYWNSLHKALRAVSNLKKLYLQTPDYDPLNLFYGCTFRLRILVIHNSLNCTINIDRAFLESQTELVKLEMARFPYQYFPTNLFPKLAILIASSSTTPQLINRPSVRAAHLRLGTIEWPISENIKSLRLTYNLAHEKTMQSFPALKFLHIDRISGQNSFPLSSGNHGLTPLLATLAHLTRLEKLFLRLLFPLLPSDVTRICEDFFHRLRSLQVLAIEDPSLSAVNPKDTCRQWLRDVQGQTIVKWREREWQDEGWD